jgi:threonine/homoserine/homoserine lactone efflux protein
VEGPLVFVSASLALLLTPGPTNTLLATSGAAVGVKRSLHLMLAEVGGYLIAVSVIALAIGPLMERSQLPGVALRAACAAYLFYAAWKLWREGAEILASDKPIDFSRVFVTTLLNPKAIVFALVVVPHLADGDLFAASPYLAGLVGMILAAATGWISAGALLRAGMNGRLGGQAIRRVGAVAMSIFAVTLSSSVVAALR